MKKAVTLLIVVLFMSCSKKTGASDEAMNVAFRSPFPTRGKARFRL